MKTINTILSMKLKVDRGIIPHTRGYMKFLLHSLQTILNLPEELGLVTRAKLLYFSDRRKRATLGLSDSVLVYLYSIFCRIDNGIGRDWNKTDVEFLDCVVNILGIDIVAQDGISNGEPRFDAFHSVDDITVSIPDFSNMEHGRDIRGTDSIPIWVVLFALLMYLRGERVLDITDRLHISYGSYYKYIFKAMIVIYASHYSLLKFPFPVTESGKVIP